MKSMNCFKEKCLETFVEIYNRCQSYTKDLVLRKTKSVIKAEVFCVMCELYHKFSKIKNKLKHGTVKEFQNNLSLYLKLNFFYRIDSYYLYCDAVKNEYD